MCIIGRVDHDLLARELLGAVCGRRSRRLLAKKLGYRTNVLNRWESGERAPSISELFRLAKLVGIDLIAVCAAFDTSAFSAGEQRLRQGDVSEFLRVLAGTQSITTLAEGAGLSRFVVSRILAGITEPKVGVFLKLLDVATGRALDWIAGFVDPPKLPSAQEEWARLTAYRRLAYDHPASEAVLALLELREQAGLSAHRPGWIASRLSITLNEEEETLQALSTAGLIVWKRNRWRVNDDQRFVDTRSDPAAFARLKQFWAQKAAEQLEARGGNLCAYVVFSATQADVEAISNINLEAFRDVRRVVRDSKPAQRAVLLTVQLTALDGKPVL